MCHICDGTAAEGTPSSPRPKAAPPVQSAHHLKGNIILSKHIRLRMNAGGCQAIQAVCSPVRDGKASTLQEVPSWMPL